MTQSHPIPLMTDPLGRHWQQPSRDCILVDDDCAMMTENTWRALMHYDSTYPLGVYNGKMWGRNEGTTRYLVWYGPHADPNQCAILFRPIIFV